MEIVLLFCTTLTKRALVELTAGARAFAQGVGWHVQVIEFDGSPLPVRKLINFWAPVGCIVDTNGNGLTSDDIPYRAFGNTPVVYLGSNPCLTPRNATRIILDATKTGEIAAHEVMTLGLERFAFLGQSDQGWSQRRYTGFVSALGMNGKTSTLFNLYPNGKNIHQLTGWLAGLPKPCGLLAASDALAETVLTVCRRTGIAVPDDIAVIGIDDDYALCENTVPTLTSIRPNFWQVGYSAARLLAQRLRRPSTKHIEETFDISGIVRRGSSRFSKRRDNFVSKALERIWGQGGASLSPKEILSDFPCSRRNAEIRFRQATGCSVLEELIQSRIQRAKQLLCDTQLPISAVAESCGYGSLAYFRKIFMRATGKKPLAWRKENSHL